MSRSMERGGGALTSNAFVDVLTCPTGHKYEVVTIGFATDSSVATQFFVAYHTTGGYTFADAQSVPAGSFGIAKSYEGLVFYEGDSVSINALQTGTHSVACVVTYIDVDYSN